MVPAIPLDDAPIDAVQKLSLNGASGHTNGDAIPDYKIKNICCVGAGYVGKSISSFDSRRRGGRRMIKLLFFCESLQLAPPCTTAASNRNFRASDSHDADQK